MPNTSTLWASGTPAVIPSGAFSSGGTNPSNATGVNDAVYATWGSSVAFDTASIEVAGFGAQTAIGSEPPGVDQVAVTVFWQSSNSTRLTSAVVALTDGSGNAITTEQNLTLTSSVGNSQTLVFAGITWAQLATLGARVAFERYNGVSVSNQQVDAVNIVVSYSLPPASGPLGLESGSGVILLEDGTTLLLEG